MNAKTPRSAIYGAIRKIWLRSRERAARLKLDEYKCQNCGVKQTKKKGQEIKVEVHHIHGIKCWDRIIELIYEEILCNTDKLETLCKECHNKHK